MPDAILIGKLTDRNLELYRLLRVYSPYNAYLYYSGADKNKIWQNVEHAKIYDQPIHTIKDSIVVLCGYSDFFLDLDKSNTIIFMASQPFLDHNELLLAAILDGIVAETPHQAYNLAHQVQYHNRKIKVTHLLPWADPKKYSISRYEDFIESPPSGIEDLPGSTIRRAEFRHGTRALFVAEPSSIYQAIQYMLSGRPVLGSSKFKELIIPGFNGYLIDQIHEMLPIVATLDISRCRELGAQARRWAQSLLEPHRYTRNFRELIEGDLPNLLPFRFERSFSDRRWIVKEKILSGGSMRFWPGEHHPDFKHIDLEDFNEILEYFSTQLFGDVYIFGFEFPEYSIQEMNRARNLTNRFGPRGYKIHFCLDSEIPLDWRNIFNKLSVISQSEGLKQIK